MPNTPTNQAGLLTQFPDNTTGLITPQNERNFVVSCVLAADTNTQSLIGPVAAPGFGFNASAPASGHLLSMSGSNVADSGIASSAVVQTTRTITTNAPLSGGGALSGNITLLMPQASGTQSGYLSSTNWTTFNNKANVAASPTTGDLASLDSGGNPTDSGISATNVLLSNADSGIVSYTSNANIAVTNLSTLESFFAAKGSSNLTLTLGFAPASISTTNTITVSEIGSGTSTVNCVGSGAEVLDDWFLNEGSGTTATNNGSLGGALTLSSASWGGAVGGESSSLNTAGGTVYATGSDAGLPTGATPFIATGWFNTSTAPNIGTLFTYGDLTGATAYAIAMAPDGTIQLRQNAPLNPIVASTIAYADGADHQWKVTYDGTTVALYVDNVLAGTHAITFNIVLAGTVYLGTDYYSEAFTGLIGRTTISGVGTTYYPVGGSTSGVSLSPGQSVRLKPIDNTIGFVAIDGNSLDQTLAINNSSTHTINTGGYSVSGSNGVTGIMNISGVPVTVGTNTVHVQNGIIVLG